MGKWGRELIGKHFQSAKTITAWCKCFKASQVGINTAIGTPK